MQIETRFSNCKDGVARIRKHVQSDHHNKAPSALYILPTQEAEVLDVNIKMDQLLENIPIGLILEDEETPALETETLLDAITKLPTEERG